MPRSVDDGVIVENMDLYESDLPPSLHSQLALLNLSDKAPVTDEPPNAFDPETDVASTFATKDADAESPEPPYRPTPSRRASWDAIDAASLKRTEFGMLARMIEIRMRIGFRALANRERKEPLTIPDPWPLMPITSLLCTLAGHPRLLQQYLQ